MTASIYYTGDTVNTETMFDIELLLYAMNQEDLRKLHQIVEDSKNIGWLDQNGDFSLFRPAFY